MPMERIYQMIVYLFENNVPNGETNVILRIAIDILLK